MVPPTSCGHICHLRTVLMMLMHLVLGWFHKHGDTDGTCYVIPQCTRTKTKHSDSDWLCSNLPLNKQTSSYPQFSCPHTLTKTSCWWASDVFLKDVLVSDCYTHSHLSSDRKWTQLQQLSSTSVWILSLLTCLSSFSLVLKLSIKLGVHQRTVLRPPDEEKCRWPGSYHDRLIVADVSRSVS